MTTNVQFFPYAPDYMSWEDWTGNLLVFYSENPIPFHSEEDWMMTANALAGLSTFSKYPVPTPETFPDWQSWAKEFTLIINGTTQ